MTCLDCIDGLIAANAITARLQCRISDLTAELVAERLEVERLRLQLIKRSDECLEMAHRLALVTYAKATAEIQTAEYREVMR